MVFDEQRRVDFGVAAVVVGRRRRVIVEHEARDGAFEAGERAFQEHEAGAGDFGGGVEIHEAQRLAQFEMLLGREGVGLRGSDFADFLIVVFILAVGDVVARQVRDDGEGRFQFRVDRAFVFFATRNGILKSGDFFHEFGGGGFIL